MELLEFVQARVAGEEAAWQEEFLADCPPEHREWAEARWDRLAATAQLRGSIALRNLGWAMAYTWWRSRLRSKAQEYADHPDFDAAWVLEAQAR